MALSHPIEASRYPSQGLIKTAALLNGCTSVAESCSCKLLRKRDSFGCCRCPPPTGSAVKVSSVSSQHPAKSWEELDCLYTPRFHFIFRILFRLILHYWDYAPILAWGRHQAMLYKRGPTARPPMPRFNAASPRTPFTCT